MKKVALITGGSRGIGYGCAEHLARAGFDLAINGVRAEADAAPALDALRQLGAEVVYCRGDISKHVDRGVVLAKVREKFGRLNVLVSNAGVAPKVRADLLETSEESWDHVVGANLKGGFFLVQAAAKWLVEQKRADPQNFSGSLIIVSSISATVVSTNRGEYCVSKAGLAMVAALFAARLGEYDLPVYEIRPGVIKTDMTSGVTEKYDKLIAGGLTVTKRWGTPDDVGRAAAALARGDFPYSTGSVIMVDGGLIMPRL
ncbi:MAG TPA: 3-ketoacyl-ACP reductase [Opitutales bacterium]|nr:3-ketoacyl-ACP reductase [Opitutales bacterium]